MRARHAKVALPRCFRGHPAGKEIVAECDIGVTGRARLMAKLVVFKNPAALKRFWWKALYYGLGRGCLGAVNNLRRRIMNPATKEVVRVEVDPRYFCIIGLCVTHLSMEVICHEANHAGFYYFERHSDTFWRAKGVNDSIDEEICHPTGRIAASINRFLHKKGLYS